MASSSSNQDGPDQHSSVAIDQSSEVALKSRNDHLQTTLTAVESLLSDDVLYKLRKCALETALEDGDPKVVAMHCFQTAAERQLHEGQIDFVTLSALLRRAKEASEKQSQGANLGSDHKATDEMKVPARVKVLASSAKAVPDLVDKNYTSLAVASMPQKTFVAAHNETMGRQVALETHANGVNILQRNNMALMNLYELVKGTGLAALDGNETSTQRLALAQEQLDKNGINCNLEALFGSMDQTIAHPSTTVYSPAAYFVELLEYLRHNNLSDKGRMEDKAPVGSPNNGYKSALGALFRRRPDLGNLELTPENTDIILPYVDIVNEIMESFIVNLDSYSKDQNKPKQASIHAYNVQYVDSDELIAQPQHLNRQAYEKLAGAIYPNTLPYNQPIEAQRQFLKLLGTSRVELLETFPPKAPLKLRQEIDQESGEARPGYAAKLQDIPVERQIECERLGITQEDYRILTHASFWSEKYHKSMVGPDKWGPEHQAQHIEGPAAHLRWGYESDLVMQDTDPNTKCGLQFVKNQFLPRAGVEFSDLLSLLQTQFINDDYPTPRSSFILEGIKADYSFLQTLIRLNETSPSARYQGVAEYLVKSELANFDPATGLTEEDLRSWAVNDFAACGKIIVLQTKSASVKEINPDQLARTDISNLRLLHLDGTILLSEEWERLDSFIRIWRRLGWSISDTEFALRTLTEIPLIAEFGDQDPAQNKSSISPNTITQLSAIVELLEITSLPVEKLLTFWAPLPTRGRNSLYQKLFFRRQMRGVNDAFKSDAFGNLFTSESATISQHRLEIMAAFGLSSAELESILDRENSPSTVSDILNIENISAIYRRSLLSKVLGIGLSEVGQFMTMFKDVFLSPTLCLSVLKTWKRLSALGFSWNEIKSINEPLPDDIGTQSLEHIDAFRLSKQIRDGVEEICNRYPLILSEHHATLEDAQLKGSALFDQDVLAGIIHLISGSTTYTISVPVFKNPHFAELVGKALPKRGLSYDIHKSSDPENIDDEATAKLSFRGILTSQEVTLVKGLVKRIADVPQPKSQVDQAPVPAEQSFPAATPEEEKQWNLAVMHVVQKPREFYDEYLKRILSNTIDTVLLAPDVTCGREKTGSGTEANVFEECRTSAQKTLAFLQAITHLLRQRLARSLIITAIGTAAGIADQSMLEVLMEREDTDILDLILKVFGLRDDWYTYISQSVGGQICFSVARDVNPDSSVIFDDGFLEFGDPKNQSGNTRESKAVTVEANRSYFLLCARALKDQLKWNVGDKIEKVSKKSFTAWKGYLNAPCTGKISFLVNMDQKPLPLRINGKEFNFVKRETPLVSIWCVDEEVVLKEGIVYHLEMIGFLPSQLRWKTAKTSLSPVSRHSVMEQDIFQLLFRLSGLVKKAATILKRIPLSARK